MDGILIALIVMGTGAVGYHLYRRQHQQSAHQPVIDHHLDLIRKQQILIKPDKQANTYSGRFAGRMFRFEFGRSLSIRAELDVNLDDDKLWIYPIKHVFKSDKFRQMLERNRAWAGRKPFDEQYIVAGRPRHFAYHVIRASLRSQNRLLEFPRSVITAEDTSIVYQPHARNLTDLTADDWYTFMSLVADLADSVEDMYEADMFSGIDMDESHPDHSGGHT